MFYVFNLILPCILINGIGEKHKHISHAWVSIGFEFDVWLVYRRLLIIIISYLIMEICILIKVNKERDFVLSTTWIISCVINFIYIA